MSTGRPFATSEFDKENFSARDFVLEKRKNYQLQDLQGSLSQYSTEIHSTLVELINAKYSDFVSLSAQMTTVDQHLEDIQNPIRDNHGFVKEFSNEVSTCLQTVCFNDKTNTFLLFISFLFVFLVCIFWFTNL